MKTTIPISSINGKVPLAVPPNASSDSAEPPQPPSEKQHLVCLDEKKYDEHSKYLNLVFLCLDVLWTFSVQIRPDAWGNYKLEREGIDFLNDVGLGDRLLVTVRIDKNGKASLLRAKFHDPSMLPMLSVDFIAIGNVVQTALIGGPHAVGRIIWNEGCEGCTIEHALGLICESVSGGPAQKALIIKFLLLKNYHYMMPEDFLKTMGPTIEALGLAKLTGIIFEKVENGELIWVGVWALIQEEDGPLLSPDDFDYYGCAGQHPWPVSTITPPIF